VILPLAGVTDPAMFGGKAVALARAVRAGLPVPAGVALSVDTVDAVVRAEAGAVSAVEQACAGGGLRAVRSSAVREDSAGASFAGTYCTVLGAYGAGGVVAAVRRVHASGDAPAARAYRARLGLRRGRMAVVVQELVPAEVAGVLFTRNPVTRLAERVIEASWGLGEAVVAGLVVPDRYRLDARGRVLERAAGEKDVALRAGPGGLLKRAVDPSDVRAPCLNDAQLAMLHALAEACDSVYGTTDHDIEFAFHAGAVFLLQRRPIPRG
jgi:pyruvate,water dikinase